MDDADGSFDREQDAEENLRGTLPAGEHVDPLSFWVAECYTPSLTDRLIEGVRGLGWGEAGRRFGLDPLDDWVEQQRWSTAGGASQHLNLVYPKEDRGSGGGPYSAHLPPGIDLADGTLFHLFPGLFVFVLQFHLGVSLGGQVDAALRREYRTRVERFAGGRRYISPTHQRRDAVAELRRATARACIRWVCEALPGRFAVEGEPAAFPTCECLVLERTRPADPDRRSPSDDYLDLLGLDRAIDAWRSADLPGLRLLLPGPLQEERFALVLAGKRLDVIGRERRRPDSGGARFDLNYRLRSVNPMLARWSLNALLHTYETEYGRIRESMARTVDRADLERSIAAVSSLEASLLRVSGDAVTVSAEMEEYLEQASPFNVDIPRFFPVHPFWSATRGGKNMRTPLGRLLRWLPLPRREPEPEQHLFESLRRWMQRRCSWLRRTEALARELVQAQGDVINAWAQHRLTTSNLRLQRAVLMLSVAALVLGGIQACQALRTDRAGGTFQRVMIVPTIPAGTPPPEMTGSSRSELPSAVEQPVASPGGNLPRSDALSGPSAWALGGLGSGAGDRFVRRGASPE